MDFTYIVSNVYSYQSRIAQYDTLYILLLFVIHLQTFNKSRRNRISNSLKRFEKILTHYSCNVSFKLKYEFLFNSPYMWNNNLTILQ